MFLWEINPHPLFNLWYYEYFELIPSVQIIKFSIWTSSLLFNISCVLLQWCPVFPDFTFTLSTHLPNYHRHFFFLNYKPHYVTCLLKMLQWLPINLRIKINLHTSDELLFLFLLLFIFPASTLIITFFSKYNNNFTSSKEPCFPWSHYFKICFLCYLPLKY